MTQVVVIGGGVAGCAAAVAAAEAGARVTLVEAHHHLGGVAAQGEHRTLCGLAPIDAATPDLLEPTLTTAWVDALATGSSRRQGRVWLWPTDAQTLQTGLARLLARAGVEVRRGGRVVSCMHDLRVLCMSDGAAVPFDTIIDASGGRTVAALVNAAATPAAESAAADLTPIPEVDPTTVNWPSYRAYLHGIIAPGTVARLRAESTAATAATAPAAALVAVTDDRWQLSLDLPPGTTVVQAEAAMQRAAAALNMDLTACARSLAHRDDGDRDQGHTTGTLSLRDLFSTTSRGWCWAAWPAEFHGADGVLWNWPLGDRHGIPLQAVRALLYPARAQPAPAYLWTVGKGMPVSASAAAALRVTGTGLALGTAVGAVVGAADANQALLDHFNAPPPGDQCPRGTSP